MFMMSAYVIILLIFINTICSVLTTETDTSQDQLEGTTNSYLNENEWNTQLNLSDRNITKQGQKRRQSFSLCTNEPLQKIHSIKIMNHDEVQSNERGTKDNIFEETSILTSNSNSYNNNNTNSTNNNDTINSHFDFPYQINKKGKNYEINKVKKNMEPFQINIYSLQIPSIYVCTLDTNQLSAHSLIEFYNPMNYKNVNENFPKEHEHNAVLQNQTNNIHFGKNDINGQNDINEQNYVTEQNYIIEQNNIMEPNDINEQNNINEKKLIVSVRKMMDDNDIYTFRQKEDIKEYITQAMKRIKKNQNQNQENGFKYSNSDMKKLYTFLYYKKDELLPINECKNPLLVLQSLDILRFFITLIFVPMHKEFKNERFNFRGKVVNKRKILNKYGISLEDYIHELHNAFDFCKYFYFYDSNSRIKQVSNLLRIIFYGGSKKDPEENPKFLGYTKELKYFTDQLEMHFYKFFIMAKKMNVLKNELSNEEFYSLINEFAFHTQQFKNKIENNIEKLKGILINTSKNDPLFIQYLFKTFGYLIINRLLIGINDTTEEYLILKSLQNFTDKFETLSAAADLLNFSEEIKETNTLHLEKNKEFIYIIFLYIKMQFLYIIVSEISSHINECIPCVNPFEKNKTCSMFMQECKQIYQSSINISYAVGIMKTFLQSFNKNKTFAHFMLLSYDKAETINAKVDQLMKFMQCRKSVFLRSEEKLMQGFQMYKQIRELYTDLENHTLNHF